MLSGLKKKRTSPTPLTTNHYHTNHYHTNR